MSLKHKIFTVIASMLAVVSILTGMSAIVKAADAPAIVWDIVNQTGTIKNGDGYTVKYATTNAAEVTWNNETGLPTNIKESAFETAECNTIDISWVSKKKDVNLVALFIDENGDVVSHQVTPIKKQVSLKVGYAAVAVELDSYNVSVYPDPRYTNLITENFKDKIVGNEESGYLYFYIVNADKTATLVDPDTVLWRTNTSYQWADITDLNLSIYKAKGATFYFHEASGEADIKGENGETSSVARFTSNEVKYTYKKQVSAPKVSLNAKSESVSLRSGLEYQISVNGGQYSDWINVTKAYGANTKSVKIEELYVLASESVKQKIEAGSLYQDEDSNIRLRVRTILNQKKGILPSKVTNLKITAASVAEIKINKSEEPDITISLVNKDNPLKGIIIKNNTNNTYEWGLASVGGSARSFTKIYANKTVKIAAGRYNLDQNFVIRLVANQSANAIAGERSIYELKKLDSSQSTGQ